MKSNPHNYDFKDKVALVSGAARGIGKTISLLFAQFGAHLALIDINREDLKNVQKEAEKLGQRALIVGVDISKKEQIRRGVERVLNYFGSIDIVINNAGVGQMDPVEEISEKKWDEVLNVNLKGLFFLTQCVGRYMIKRKKGKVINISSQAGLIGIPGHAAYSSSKAGVIGLTKTLAVEWGVYNINVNAVAPTVVNTEMAKIAWSDPKVKKDMISKIPLGRFGEPIEVAYAVLFLASNMSDFITGITLPVDGGYTAQ